MYVINVNNTKILQDYQLYKDSTQHGTRDVFYTTI